MDTVSFLILQELQVSLLHSQDACIYTKYISVIRDA